MKVLVTSGGTKIKLDLVRSITNMSRGTFGSKIATSFSKLPLDTDITFLYAKNSKLPYCNSLNDCFRRGIKLVEYVTFDDYEAELEVCLKQQPDIIVLAAAVSDYGVENPVNGKIRSGNDLIIKLVPLPKLISTVREICPNSVLCGFKLLVNSTEEELKEAIYKSVHANKCDLVVGNDLRDIKNDNHKLIIGERDKSPDPDYFGVNYRFYSKENTPNLAQVVVEHCMKKYKEKQ